ncbi:MAG: bifunctional methionine sulfoxide reductase B/A protein [Candidatus Aminicenantes bacterium]|nr:bifunctional methionine sulfoxide reductase B/A protein [Acidobacteriota bacterium]MCG2810582.1 bifunctional methionine sulfoxide reductase B/A protein [Candidatus Aminicenantes bacterium]
MTDKKLTSEKEQVNLHKGTELPFSGKYYAFNEKGTYVCKRCGTALYLSSAKFDSGCGWPSFDAELPGAVKRQTDADGLRTEISCASCGAHLGHAFIGEGFTAQNIRHCVNSISMNFVPADEKKTETAIFASGCFWGTQYYLQQAQGVLTTTVGFAGGPTANPTYEEVSSGASGYAEAVQVVFDPEQISYEELAKLFFETHDFTEIDRQGPDIGSQYRSEIFYQDEDQRRTAEKLSAILKAKGFKVATRLSKAGPFWPAKDYHQNYYQKSGSLPYCHVYRKIF